MMDLDWGIDGSRNVLSTIRNALVLTRLQLSSIIRLETTGDIGTALVQIIHYRAQARDIHRNGRGFLNRWSQARFWLGELVAVPLITSATAWLALAPSTPRRVDPGVGRRRACC